MATPCLGGELLQGGSPEWAQQEGLDDHPRSGKLDGQRLLGQAVVEHGEAANWKLKNK
jgi:hypothetical protein